MRIVRSAQLFDKSGASDKIYEVELVELSSAASDRYVVNFRFGRRGSRLQEGSKTPAPVTLDAAERLYESVIVSKVNGGYRRAGDAQGAGLGAPAGDPNPAGREEALLARLDRCLAERWPPKQRERLLWRVGVVRIAPAFPKLVEYVRVMEPRLAGYSLVHALARCGGAEAAPLLAEIAATNESAVTRDYAAFALASPLMGDARAEPLVALSCPPALKPRFEDATARADGPGLLAVLNEAEAARPGAASDMLIALAHHMASWPPARPALLATLRVTPARLPFVRALRRLFKYSDLADDAALFAETARAFELAQPMYRRARAWNGLIWIDLLQKQLKLAQERAKPFPAIALSDATLLYFKRRVWRMLRKRGELGQESFAQMAAQYLLAFSDSDAVAPRVWSEYREQPNASGRPQWTRVERRSGPFRKVWALGQLLYRHAPGARLDPRGLGHSDIREEGPFGPAFAELWGDQPAILLQLAAGARNRTSALFAVAMLAPLAADMPAPDGETLLGLVRSPYTEVQNFAETLAQRLFAERRETPGLVAALLAADHDGLRKLAIGAVEARPEWPWADEELALAVLISAHEDVATRAGEWLGRERTPEVGARFVGDFIDWLASLPAPLDNATPARMSRAVAHLRALWPNHDLPATPKMLVKIGAHPSHLVRAAALDLLGLSATRVEDLPDSFWAKGLGAAESEVRAATVRLLARLPAEKLAARAAQVRAAALDTDAESRAAARPLVTRLAARDPAFATSLFDEAFALLFRADPSDGYGADLATMLIEAFPEFGARLDAGTLWRLLQAKATGARHYGAHLLGTRSDKDFSVKQLARLGAHPYARVRAFALAALERDEARFQAEPDDAALFLDNRWDDARDAALARFEKWPEPLPPSALAVVADSPLPAVQDSAKALLRRSLDGPAGGEVLERLLEHPSSAMHLFVTELLAADALKEPTRFEKFLVQARVILLRIAKGRVAKQRVYAVLAREALASRERAASIWPLLHDVTLSVVEKDRAPALLALRDIRRAFPDLPIPLGFVPPEKRSA